MVSLLMLMIMTAMLQETGPDFVIRNMEEYLCHSKYCDLAFICSENMVSEGVVDTIFLVHIFDVRWCQPTAVWSVLSRHT